MTLQIYSSTLPQINNFRPYIIFAFNILWKFGNNFVFILTKIIIKKIQIEKMYVFL